MITSSSLNSIRHPGMKVGTRVLELRTTFYKKGRKEKKNRKIILCSLSRHVQKENGDQKKSTGGKTKKNDGGWLKNTYTYTHTYASGTHALTLAKNTEPFAHLHNTLLPPPPPFSLDEEFFRNGKNVKRKVPRGERFGGILWKVSCFVLVCYVVWCGVCCLWLEDGFWRGDGWCMVI